LLTSLGVTDGLIQARLLLTQPELWPFSPPSPVTVMVQLGEHRRPRTTCSQLLYRCFASVVLQTLKKYG